MKYDFRAIRTHTIRGRRYQIVWRRPKTPRSGAKKVHKDITYLASIDSPDKNGRVLRITPRTDPLKILACVIHEGIHGGHWDLEEAAVEETDTDIMRLLIRMGIKVDFNPPPTPQCQQKRPPRKKKRTLA